MFGRLRHRRLAGVIMFVGGIGIMFSTISVGDNDLTNQEALINEAFFASVFGLYLWYLQKTDNDKMQIILDKQTALAEEIHTHITQQQYIQDSIRSESIRLVTGNLKWSKLMIGKSLYLFEKIHRGANAQIMTQRLDEHLSTNDEYKWLPRTLHDS